MCGQTSRTGRGRDGFKKGWSDLRGETENQSLGGGVLGGRQRREENLGASHITRAAFEKHLCGGDCEAGPSVNHRETGARCGATAGVASPGVHLIMPTMPLMLRCRPEVFITNNNRQTFHAHMKLMRPERAARHLPESCTRGRRLTGRRRRRRTTSTMTRRSGRPLFSRRSYPARASGRGCGVPAASVRRVRAKETI